MLAHRQRGKIPDRVNTTAAQKYQPSLLFAAVFENIQSPNQIMFTKLPGTRPPVHTCKDTRVGSGINDPITVWNQLDIAAHPEITVEKLYIFRREVSTITFRSRSQQVIDAKYFRLGQPLTNSYSESASDEAADPGYQNPHPLAPALGSAPRRASQEFTISR